MNITPVLVCYRIVDLPIPNTASTIDHCMQCGFSVWHANSSPPASPVICIPCFEAQCSAEDFIKSPTVEQLRDIKRKLSQ